MRRILPFVSHIRGIKIEILREFSIIEAIILIPSIVAIVSYAMALVDVVKFIRDIATLGIGMSLIVVYVRYATLR